MVTVKSPSTDPVRSHPELDYAPPWARGEFPMVVGNPAALPVEMRAQNQLVSNDSALHQRSLENIIGAAHIQTPHGSGLITVREAPLA